MPLQIKYSINIEDLLIVSHKPDSGNASLKSAKEADCEIEVPYILDCKTDYSPNDYLVFMFARKEPSENDIFQVWEKKQDQRVGWIFPIQALQSREHSFAAHEHFLKYAFVAFQLLCKGETNAYPEVPHYGEKDSYSIDEFYAEDSIILCLSKAQIPDLENFSIDDYLPSFFKFGYYLQIQRDPIQICISGEVPEEDRIKLKISPISSSYKGNRFIKSLLSEVLPYERVPILSFFYLYQIIELLMERVLFNDQQRKIEKLIANKDKPSKLIEIFEEMKGSFSEKNRLKTLFDEYLPKPPSNDLDELKSTCNEFLTKHNKKIGTGFWNYLYNVRNLLFHQYRDVDQGDNKELKKIVECFRLVITDLLTNYYESHQSQSSKEANV